MLCICTNRMKLTDATTTCWNLNVLIASDTLYVKENILAKYNTAMQSSQTDNDIIEFDEFCRKNHASYLYKIYDSDFDKPFTRTDNQICITRCVDILDKLIIVTNHSVRHILNHQFELHLEGLNIPFSIAIVPEVCIDNSDGVVLHFSLQSYSSTYCHHKFHGIPLCLFHRQALLFRTSLPLESICVYAGGRIMHKPNQDYFSNDSTLHNLLSCNHGKSVINANALFADLHVPGRKSQGDYNSFANFDFNEAALRQTSFTFDDYNKCCYLTLEPMTTCIAFKLKRKRPQGIFSGMTHSLYKQLYTNSDILYDSYIGIRVNDSIVYDDSIVPLYYRGYYVYKFYPIVNSTSDVKIILNGIDLTLYDIFWYHIAAKF